MKGNIYQFVFDLHFHSNVSLVLFDPSSPTTRLYTTGPYLVVRKRIQNNYLSS